MIDPQQSRKRWELSPRVNLGVLVNSMEGTRVRLAPFARRVFGALVSSIELGRVKLPAGGAHCGAFVTSITWSAAGLLRSPRASWRPRSSIGGPGRIEPLVRRLCTVQLPSSRVAKVRIDVVGRIKAAAMWTFAMIELGVLIALIVGAFLIYASTTKSALIS